MGRAGDHGGPAGRDPGPRGAAVLRVRDAASGRVQPRPVPRRPDRHRGGRRAARAVLHDGPGYPYVVPAHEGRVVGTLLTPSPGDYGDLFGLLDRLELPVGYERVAMDVERVRDGARVSAWVFLAAPDAPLGPVIESGDWFRKDR
ncbi:gamma-glutamylcyclotransferase [Streptomyces diastatochromogenes]|nr:gamma-glutamylcyclotransferase [Streptomyces diastatochromogenes]